MSTGNLREYSKRSKNSPGMEPNLLRATDGLKMWRCDGGGWMGTSCDSHPFILAWCFLWCSVVGLWLVLDAWHLPKWTESLVI